MIILFCVPIISKMILRFLVILLVFSVDASLDPCETVGSLKGDENDCQSFYQCTHNGWAYLQCLKGLVFNEEISVCDWPKPGTKCGNDISRNPNSGDGNQGQSQLEACAVVGQLRGDETNCQKFYQCTHNGWAPLICKKGLFFNEDISVCDWPKEGTKCGKDSHTSDNSDDHASQNDQSKFVSCDEVGKLKRDEQDCQKFYQCTHNGWAPKKCKDGLFFNEDISVCDWPKEGTKCGKDTHTDGHSADGHQGQDGEPKYDACDVVGKLKGDEQDCQIFYQCTHTGWAPMKCEDGLFFNEEKSVCDWPKAGTKCEKDTHTDDHSTDGHQDKDQDQDQDGQPKYDACDVVGKLKGDEQDCQIFYQCTHIGWAPMKCKDGLFFNEEISVCDWPKEGKKCGKDTHTDDHSADGHQDQDKDQDQDGQPKYDACDVVGKLKGDEQDCQIFYQCTHTGWAPMKCKDGLFFNEEISVCDWPKEGEKCGKDTHTDDHSADGHQDQDGEPKYDACDVVGKLKGDEQDCQIFYQCTHTGWAPMKCKDGLFFNEEKSVCDWPKAGTKCGKDTHTDDHSADGHQDQDQDGQPKYDACDVVGKLKGNEQDCQLFYQCTHIGWAPMKCKDGLFFNEEKSVCDWPKAGTKCGKDTHTDDHSTDGHQDKDQDQDQDGQPKYDACNVVGKLKGDEQDCQIFYQCTHIGWAPMKCKDGLFFNEEISVCDWPKEGEKCGKDTHTDDHSADGHQDQDQDQDGQPKYDACDVVGKLKGDEQDCQIFYQCTHTGWAPMKCKDGLFFNEEISVCDWPKEGKKCGKDTHTDDHSADGHQDQDQDQDGQPKYDACDVVGKLKGDEQDCQIFYQCTHIGWAPMKCKDGLFFNEEFSVCDWPKEGKKCGKDTHTDDHSADGHQDQDKDQDQDGQPKYDACDVVGKLKGDEQDCQIFYQCTHTGWAPMKCKDGLFFNEEKSVCDWPKAGTKCEKDTHTDDHSTDGHQDKDQDQDQDGQPKYDACDVVGKLKGDEQDCQIFYQCTHIGWAPMKCKDGLFFNEEFSVCDWPKEGKKCGKDTHTDDHSADGHQDQDKDQDQDGQPKYDACDVVGKLKGNEQDCQLFYQCTHIGWAPMKCKDGLFFNEEKSVCDWPKAGTKCGKDTHTDDHSTDGHQDKDQDQDQDGQPKYDACDVVGKLKGDEQDCQIFYQCTHIGWAPMKCKDGLFFNEEISVCDWPKEGKKCGKDTHTDDHSADGHQDKDQDQDQDGQPKYDACDVVGKLKGDEQDCQIFYQCTHTGWAPMKCKDGLFFNEEKSVCDWPKAGTKCGKDTHTDDHSADGHQDQDGQPEYDACDVVGNLKGDEQDCQVFYQCTHTGWAPMKCKDGLFFNEEKSVCDWPKAGIKCGNDTHTDDHSADHSHDDDSNQKSCQMVGKLKGDEEDCQNFYQCTHSGWQKLRCKDGLYFNTKISVCDWPKAGSKCGSDDGSDHNSRHNDDDHSENDHNDNNHHDDDDHVSYLEPCDILGQIKEDSDHCDLYYHCTSCGWSLKPCEFGLLFNSKTSACDRADRVTCSRDNINNDYNDEPIDACENVGQLKSDPKDCKRYYQCTTYGWQNMPCYNHLFFNPEKSICDYSYNVKCEIN